MKPKLIIVLIIISFLFLDCRRRKSFDQDVEDCDTIGNHYDDGVHYINRDIVTDEGVIDYKKLLDGYKGKNTVCNPEKLLEYK